MKSLIQLLAVLLMMFTLMTMIVVFRPSVQIQQGGDVNFIELSGGY